MRKPSWLNTLEDYKANGYSDEIIANIESLQSQDSFDSDLLEEYRYLQPDGDLFSERSLKIIIALHNIESRLEAQREISYEIGASLKKLIKMSFQNDELE